MQNDEREEQNPRLPISFAASTISYSDKKVERARSASREEFNPDRQISLPQAILQIREDQQHQA